MDSVIKLVDVCKVYGDGMAAVKGLEHINLEIEKGTFTSIVGKSGSGKSTLLNIIGALDTPTSGKIFFNGKELKVRSDKELSALRRREIGFVFQQYRLLPEFTLWDNICLPCYLDKSEPDADYVRELLEILELWQRRKAYPGEFSGGQQQRIAIARAMAHKPSVLLADEPTGNLDSEMGERVMELLDTARQKYKQTIVLVTHDKELAARAENKITIINGVI